MPRFDRTSLNIFLAAVTQKPYDSQVLQDTLRGVLSSEARAPRHE